MQLALFGWVEEAVRPRLTRRVKKTGTWEVEDHACRHCMGRLLSGVSPDGQPILRCAECGATAQGTHDVMCWCGIEMPKHGRVFECFKNPEVSLSAPQEILVQERTFRGGDDQG